LVLFFRSSVSLKRKPTYHCESDKSQEERNIRFAFQVQRHSIAFSSRAELELKLWKLYHCKSIRLYRSSSDKFRCPPRQWRAVYSRISHDWPGCHFLCKAKEMGLPLVFVVDLVGQRGSDPPPNGQLSLQHAEEKTSGEQRTMVFPASN
jgi:hypothetical protein